jgi:glycerophosphoryl diester phosphodiesterase
MATRRSALAGLSTATTSAFGALAPSPAVTTGLVAPAVGRGNDNHNDRRSIVIAHRGACGYRPEHTLASYELAARLGADYLEPDLVPTKDGVLVCRHEPEIGDTTDVADHSEFASRKKTVMLDGAPVTGWFTEDFTLAELKTLRAKERLPQIRRRNTRWDRRFAVPTFQELLDLRARLSHELGREIGVYPETKHPTYFLKLGLPLEERLLDILHRNGLNTPHAPVFVQSFEVGSLRRLRQLGIRVPLIQLLSATGLPYDSMVVGSGPTYADMLTTAGLATIAQYAQGIGPDKNVVIPRTADNSLGTPTALVDDAHDAGLLVHPYTFRAENIFLPTDLQIGTPARPTDYGRAIDEQVAFLDAGVDGLFADHCDIGVEARRQFRSRPGPPARPLLTIRWIRRSAALPNVLDVDDFERRITTRDSQQTVPDR